MGPVMPTKKVKKAPKLKQFGLKLDEHQTRYIVNAIVEKTQRGERPPGDLARKVLILTTQAALEVIKRGN